MLPAAISLLGIAVAVYLAIDFREELHYAFFGTAQPVDLGRTGAYHPERARHGVFARVEGSPGQTAARWIRFDPASLSRRRFEAVAVKESPFLVRRRLEGPPLPRRPGEGEPAPRPGSFRAEGRLIRDDRAGPYREAFRILVDRGDVAPPGPGEHLYLLLDGERPRQGWSAPALVVLLAAVLVGNGLTLARVWRRRSLPRESPS